jgi:hypothetical protein
MGQKGSFDAKGARPRKRHYALIKGAHENTARVTPTNEIPQAVEKRFRELGLRPVVDTQPIKDKGFKNVVGSKVYQCASKVNGHHNQDLG